MEVSELFNFVKFLCACVYSSYKPVHGHVTTASALVQSRSYPHWGDLYITKETASSDNSATNDQVMMWEGL